MTNQEPTIHDQTNLLPKGRLVIVFCALASALLISFVDQNSIGVALPTIGRDLDSCRTIVWAGTSSMIANTAFQVLYGRLSDILGRKVILVTCICLLALGDVLCSFARTGPQLYAFRGISGLANGGIIALTNIVVSDITTLQQRGKYQGILGSCVGLGNTIGPFLGAAFTRSVTWRATFWFIAPLAIGVAVMLYVLLPPQTLPPEPTMDKLKKIDYVGGILSSFGTILLLIPVSGIGTQFETTDPMVIGMITVGSVFLAAFLFYEFKFAKLPMFPLRLFNNPALAALMTQNFLIGVAYFSLLYYLPIFYQSARQMSLMATAALILPLVIPQATASALSGQYTTRMKRYGEVIWTGYICWTIAAALQCTFTRTTPTVAIVFILAMEGIGVGLVFQPTLVAAQAHSPKKDRAVIISSRNFIRSLGAAVGLATSGAIFSNTLVDKITDVIPADVAQKMRRSIFTMPEISNLTGTQQVAVLNVYAQASRTVSYLWVGAITVCLALMIFIKDQGLERKDEKTGEREDDKVATGPNTPDSVGSRETVVTHVARV
ncbi:major facilitator superfamily domain-containing protein [Biscogniauxia marginata]|nr:major facilitator superfamily domain-containing protein [Biscogniauxia marginata]